VGCTPVSAVGEQMGGRELGKLAGKVAIVTGGGWGIGRVITHAYLQEDTGVVVTAAQKKAEIEEGLVEETGPTRSGNLAQKGRFLNSSEQARMY
jgi:NAD(P)-dependent dehydrogenase (short-subunit alcohol dehydrogenase family)